MPKICVFLIASFLLSGLGASTQSQKSPKPVRGKDARSGAAKAVGAGGTQPSPVQAEVHVATIQPPPCPVTTQGNGPSGEVKSFSELTLFLFASALALFIALLGWSDQIRGINKDTKELEDRFLDETGIEKRDFLAIVKPKVPGKQLAVLAKLMKSGKIQSHVKVDLLSTFKAWNKDWSRLERISTWKYSFAVTLTVVFFLAGVASLFTHASDVVHLRFFTLRTEILVLTVPLAVIAVLLGIIIYASRRENALRTLLESIADEV